MENTFWTALVASLLAATATTFGIYTIRHFEEWGRRNLIYFICFGTGVLLSVSFLHLIPEAINMNSHTPIYLLVGFFTLYLLNHFITDLTRKKNPDANYAFGLIPLLGIGFHSFIGGFIYSISFVVNIFTGTLSAIGMVLHEFPEGIITYLLLLRGGFSEKKALILAFLAAALTTPLGMLASYPYIHQIDRAILGLLLALSAGMLIYVGATHLLPHANKEHRRYNLLALGLGALVVVFIVVVKSEAM